MKPITKDKNFKKHYAKRIAPNPKLAKQFDDRIRAFVLGKRDSPLDDHPLKGEKLGLRAFSIAGDVRVVYRDTEDAYVFLDVGTHNQDY
jgi:mRNA-degrading endonuclease YafQ of YafQ-DinJ toxin-antitoxin module